MPRRATTSFWLIVALVAGGAIVGITTVQEPGRSGVPVGSSVPTRRPLTLQNPLPVGDFPDPDLVHTSEGYFAVSSGPPDVSIQAATSVDFATWNMIGEALPELPPWATPDPALVWAPDVSYFGNEYHLWFTARDRVSGRQCIGVARASSPRGPFKADGPEPEVCQVELGGSIDPAIFVDADGVRWLLWKSDGNCCEIKSQIWSQRLDESGLHVTEEPTSILERDRDWEAGNVPGKVTIEAPAMVRAADGVLHLFYSGNGWDTANYAVGHAVCDRPSGPCLKSRDYPILASSGEVTGPGGGSIVEGPDRTLWFAYHAWTRGHEASSEGPGRRMHLNRLVLRARAATVIGPVSTESFLPVP
jgi:beta-xylosidase